MYYNEVSCLSVKVSCRDNSEMKSQIFVLDFSTLIIYLEISYIVDVITEIPIV